MKSDDICSCLHVIDERDGQTVRHRQTAGTALIIAHTIAWKNVFFLKPCGYEFSGEDIRSIKYKYLDCQNGLS